MSTYWYLHCRTCNTTEHVGWWNHGVDRGLRDILRALPDLARLASARGPFVSIEVTGPEYTNGIVDFAVEHHTHDVVCKSEYGDIDGTCGERYSCPTCGDERTCTKPIGHDLEHKDRP